MIHKTIKLVLMLVIGQMLVFPVFALSISDAKNIFKKLDEEEKATSKLSFQTGYIFGHYKNLFSTPSDKVSDSLQTVYAVAEWKKFLDKNKGKDKNFKITSTFIKGNYQDVVNRSLNTFTQRHTVALNTTHNKYKISLPLSYTHTNYKEKKSSVAYEFAPNISKKINKHKILKIHYKHINEDYKLEDDVDNYSGVTNELGASVINKVASVDKLYIQLGANIKNKNTKGDNFDKNVYTIDTNFFYQRNKKNTIFLKLQTNIEMYKNKDSVALVKREDFSRSVSPGVIYSFDKKINLILQAQYGTSNSNIDSEDYDATNYSLHLNKKF